MFYFRYFQILTSGFFAGVCTTAIMAPGERIKCILQVGSIMIIIIIIDKEFTKSACVEVFPGWSYVSQYMWLFLYYLALTVCPKTHVLHHSSQLFAYSYPFSPLESEPHKCTHTFSCTATLKNFIEGIVKLMLLSGYF